MKNYGFMFGNFMQKVTVLGAAILQKASKL